MMSIRMTISLLCLALLAPTLTASAARTDDRGVIAVPAALDLGTRGPDATAGASVWLINTTDEPVDILAIKGSCGCITVAGFEPTTLGPRESLELTPVMKASKTIGVHKRKALAVRIEGQAKLSIPMELRTVHPLEAAVRDFLDTSDGDRTEHLSKDSRIWFDKRDGAGVRREGDGSGPWAGWDRTMHAEHRIDDVRVFEDDRVEVTIVETNDFYRLLERPAARLRLTFWFDEDQRIEGTLVVGLDRNTDGRFNEFIRWARANAPDEIAELYPQQRIDPGAQQARRWRVLLRQWRKDAGLPAV